MTIDWKSLSPQQRKEAIAQLVCGMTPNTEQWAPHRPRFGEVLAVDLPDYAKDAAMIIWLLEQTKLPFNLYQSPISPPHQRWLVIFTHNGIKGYGHTLPEAGCIVLLRNCGHEVTT